MSLHPEVKTMLDALAASEWKDIPDLTPTEAREQSLLFAKMRQFPQVLPEVNISDFKVARDSGQSILLRRYQSTQSLNNTVIIFYHGGGFVLGSVEQYDTTCRWMAQELGATVISVDYRLAPEHSFPVQIEDSYAALEWIAANAKKIGVDNHQVVVAGDSAGGYLATMVSILARNQNGPKIDWQWLLYPWVDEDFSRPSYQTYATGYLLSTAAARWFYEHYIHDGRSAAYPAFPMQVNDLSNLPPAYIIAAECDILHDEIEAYAQKLKAAGNIVHYKCMPGMIHGFLNQYNLRVSFDATTTIMTQFKNYLTTAVAVK